MMATLKRPNFMSAEVTFSADEVVEMKREADEAGKDWREIAYRRAAHIIARPQWENLLPNDRSAFIDAAEERIKSDAWDKLTPEERIDVRRQYVEAHPLGSFPLRSIVQTCSELEAMAAARLAQREGQTVYDTPLPCDFKVREFFAGDCSPESETDRNERIMQAVRDVARGQ